MVCIVSELPFVCCCTQFARPAQDLADLLAEANEKKPGVYVYVDLKKKALPPWVDLKSSGGISFAFVLCTCAACSSVCVLAVESDGDSEDENTKKLAKAVARANGSCAVSRLYCSVCILTCSPL